MYGQLAILHGFFYTDPQEYGIIMRTSSGKLSEERHNERAADKADREYAFIPEHNAVSIRDRCARESAARYVLVAAA